MIAAFILPACTKEGAPPKTATSSQAGTQISSGNLKVSILPASPTILTDLQAFFTGEGKVSYQWKRNGQPVSGANSEKLTKDQFVKGDTVAVTVVSGTLEGTVSLVIGNAPPSVVSVPFSPEELHAGVDITVKPIGSDPDGDEVGFHYKWSVNGKELPEDTPVLTKDKFKAGDNVTLVVVPFDRDGAGAPFTSKDMIIPNAAPRITSNPPQDFKGDVYTYQVMADDPDGDTVAFSLVSPPPGMTIDSKTGSITWKLNEKSSGTYAIEIVAQDPGGMKTTQKYTLSIEAKEGVVQ